MTNIFSKYNKSGWLTAALLLCAAVFTSCSELDDKDHYKNTNSFINSKEIMEVNASSEEFLNSSEEYSKITNLLKEHGIFDELNAKGQFSTILVVADSKFKEPEGTDIDKDIVTRAHVSDMAISPANLKTEKNNMRLMTWNGKYVNVNLDEEAMNHGVIVTYDEEKMPWYHIMFNTSAVKKVIKTNNGYIYELTDMIDTPQSLNDFINALNDNYSIIRDSIKASGGRDFDKKNSKPIGVNDEGNTVYDSVFIYSNKHFEEKNIDLNSESLTATMLLMSNDVIEDAINDAYKRINMWDLATTWETFREHDIRYTLTHWVMDVAFFDKKYTADELCTADETVFMQSIFGKDWKPSAQQVDATPIELSNAYVYEVKKLHIPNNLLIYRLKDEFFIYEYCTDEQKTNWFGMTNMAFNKCNEDVAAWSPLEGVWPMHANRVLICKPGEDASGEWQLDFTPCKRIFAVEKMPTRQEMTKSKMLLTALNVDEVKPFLIPPGKYRLAFGSKQNQNLDVIFTVVVDGKEVAKSSAVTLGSKTTWHYDRGADMSDSYPEGYNKSAEGLSSKAGNYDTDGGLIIDELEIPDVKGDGSAVEVKFRIFCPGWGTVTSMVFNHWCLRPTRDNY